VLPAAGPVARDDDVDRRVQDRFDLEVAEGPGPCGGQTRGVDSRLVLRERLDPLAAGPVGDQDEIPRLREADRRGLMRRAEHAVQHVIGYRVGQEPTPHVPPLADDPVNGTTLWLWIRMGFWMLMGFWICLGSGRRGESKMRMGFWIRKGFRMRMGLGIHGRF
jgi:hypothetical protein